MKTALEQQNFPDPNESPEIYGNDPSAEIAKPDGTYYAIGVDVNYTAPAKWWNWLWNHITAWFRDSKSDRSNILTELLNTLSLAEITPSAADNTQLSAAVDVIGYKTSENYDFENITEDIGGTSITHRKNRPYVIGNTLYMPNTELL